MSPARSLSRTYSLEQAAGEAPALAALMARARRSRHLLEQVLHRIPPGLRPQVQAGPLDDTRWCLLVSSPSAATKLRHLTPLLLQDLSQLDAQVTGIRIKIQSGGR